MNNSIKILLIQNISKIIKLVFIFIALAFLSCSAGKKTDDSLESVHVYYFKGHFESPASVSCESIVVSNQKYTSVADTVILDRKVLREIDSCLEALNNPLNNKSIDARIKCELNYSNSEMKTLCIGEKFGMSCDGETYRNNLFLIYLIKRHSGYYNYFPINHLKYFKELKDANRRNTIIKEMDRQLYFKSNSNENVIDIIKP